MWLVDCRAGPISENRSAVNVLTVHKHYASLQESSFILLFYYSVIDRAEKRSSLSDLKS